MRRLMRPQGLAVGDRVRFDGQVRLVLGVSGRSVALSDLVGAPRAVVPAVLFADDDFEVMDSPERMPLPPVSLLETLPQAVLEKALWWEGHILEVLHGLPPDEDAGTEPQPQYALSRSLTARERAKAVELTAAGHKVSAGTVANYRRRYAKDGVMGLADHRPVRRTPKYGAVDGAVVDAMRQAISEAADASTRTGTFLLWRTEQILKAGECGQEAKLPSRRTLYRLLDKLTTGTHTTGSAKTRRSRAYGASAPFGELPALAPGEVMQIDSTPLDVLVRLDDGVAGTVELTGMVDVATRTVTAAVLRPTTKAVDASVLLARTVTPELMRPGWTGALRMSRSVLPHRRLLPLDERLEHAAARPVIVPEMIVCDHGKAFMSRNFLASCRFLQIDLQPAHKGSPFEKGTIERTLASVGTLFTQFLPGFTGRSTEHRGQHLDKHPLWSLLELQELLDEWIVAHWQNRPHDGLRDPSAPGRSFTPNEKYAALVEACGYVPVALSGDDYVELLPSLWRAVNDYGIKIKRRTYDSPDLAGLRRQHSGIKEKKGLWEVHHDPYDVSRIWVRDHHTGSGWIEATWKHLHRVPVPFGELAWDHAVQGLPAATEAEIADAVATLLAKAHAGPGQQAKPKRTARDKRVAARTRAAGPAAPAPAALTAPAVPQTCGEDTEPLAEVIPLGLFNPLEDPWRRS
ncbi:Mu transposase C-terminal domain-containing protein [Streptomyces chrestomyceticus]|uniref:Mu transposase C-terminal domain-containing protein n=1 Tax=Streptomyces chrestomyceticus TaxID=68185 RepID=A0ABU7WUN1_9ACTN